jgi:hypothetical protein
MGPVAGVIAATAAAVGVDITDVALAVVFAAVVGAGLVLPLLVLVGFVLDGLLAVAFVDVLVAAGAALGVVAAGAFTAGGLLAVVASSSAWLMATKLPVIRLNIKVKGRNVFMIKAALF